MTLLSAALAACAVMLVVRASGPVAGRGQSGGRDLRVTGLRGLPVPLRWSGPVLAGAVLVPVVDGRQLVLALVGIGAGSGAWSLLARGRRRVAADARQAKVVEVCEALVGELRAGQPLVTCLEHGLAVWPELEPVVAAGRLGADVPAALRSLSRLPGASGLGEAAAAWQISAGSGTGLSFALGQVAESARQAETTRQLVRSELSSAQATARLVALLPFGALAMGAGIGADPWHILLATPLGLTCLATGLGLAYLGLLWIDRIAAAVLAR